MMDFRRLSPIKTIECHFFCGTPLEGDCKVRYIIGNMYGDFTLLFL